MSMGAYLKFGLAAAISMLAGTQLVHMYYRPLDDLDELVQKELEARRKAARVT